MRISAVCFFVQGLDDEYQEEGKLLGHYTYEEDGESLQSFPVMVTEEAPSHTSVCCLQIFTLCSFRSRMTGPSRSSRCGCCLTGVIQNTPACTASECMENLGLSEPTTTRSQISPYLYIALTNICKTDSTGLNDGKTVMLWIVKGICLD